MSHSLCPFISCEVVGRDPNVKALTTAVVVGACVDARGCEVSRAALVGGAGVEAPGEAVGGACVVS